MHPLFLGYFKPIVQQITGATLETDGTVTMPVGQQTNAALRAQIDALQLDLGMANQLLLLTQEQVSTQTQLLTAQASELSTQVTASATMSGKLVTLQELADSYTTALAASLADRQTLHNADAANLTVDAQQQTSIQQNTTALAALTNRFRSVRLNVPAMALAGTATLQATWPTPFADANYSVAVGTQSTGLLKIRITLGTATAAGMPVQIENLAGLSLLSGAGTIHLFAFHD